MRILMLFARKSQFFLSKTCIVQKIVLPLHRFYGDSLAQLVEHIPFKDGVVGSNPTRITTKTASTTACGLSFLYPSSQSFCGKFWVQWKNTGGLKQKHKKQPVGDASASHLSLVLWHGWFQAEAWISHTTSPTPPSYEVGGIANRIKTSRLRRKTNLQKSDYPKTRIKRPECVMRGGIR